MRKRTNAFALILITLLVPVFFAGTERMGFQVQLTHNAVNAWNQPTDLGAYKLTYSWPQQHANAKSMFAGVSINIPRRTLPDGPIRYYGFTIHLRHMDAYW